MPSTTTAAALVVLLGLIMGASAQYSPSQGGTVLSKSGGSSATAYNLPTSDLVMLTITLAPCTGLQPHTHNTSESNFADLANNGPIKMAYVDDTNTYIYANVQPGERFVNPTGLVHYQYNPNCSPVSYTATLPLGADLQLTLSALQQIPASDYGIYATTPAANAIPGFFATNPACMKACARRR